MTKPTLTIVGASEVAEGGGIDVPDSVAANWKAAMSEILRLGGTGGVILYRNASGDWGYEPTPDMGEADVWGLMDLAHRHQAGVLENADDE